jgi:hypothetical protein
MLEINARSFVVAISGLRNMETVLKEISDGSFTITDSNWVNELVARLSRFRKELVTLEADSAVDEIDRSTEKLYDHSLTIDRCLYFAESIRSRLEDDMKRTKLLSLNSEEQGYFASTPFFGGSFAEKFQTDGVFELDEAAKCIALGRPTAAVFHLMRLVEVGIRALARCLNIPDPLKPAERNWGHILGEIKKGYEARWPTVAARAQGNGELFEHLHASLDAVKNPWRNATMHVENKYTDDEAKHIFAAVKGFMKKLADRCNENGDPKA